MTKDQAQKIEEAAVEYGKILRGNCLSLEQQTVAMLAFHSGAHWALQNLITNHESQSAIRREPIGEDLED